MPKSQEHKKQKHGESSRKRMRNQKLVAQTETYAASSSPLINYAFYAFEKSIKLTVSQYCLCNLLGLTARSFVCL